MHFLGEDCRMWLFPVDPCSMPGMGSLQVLETLVGMHVPCMCTAWVTCTCGGTSGAQLCFLPARPGDVKNLMEGGIKI